MTAGPAILQAAAAVAEVLLPPARMPPVRRAPPVAQGRPIRLPERRSPRVRRGEPIPARPTRRGRQGPPIGETEALAPRAEARAPRSAAVQAARGSSSSRIRRSDTPRAPEAATGTIRTTGVLLAAPGRPAHRCRPR